MGTQSVIECIRRGGGCPAGGRWQEKCVITAEHHVQFCWKKGEVVGGKFGLRKASEQRRINFKEKQIVSFKLLLLLAPMHKVKQDHFSFSQSVIIQHLDT